ncbi:MAG TPA: hypothetical protein VHB21_01500, partial [Minicystis sp.]|nr:hypothetical protein [Minicystis sp.]
VLHDVLGATPQAVAYPVGYRLKGALRRAPAEARFSLGFTNNTGLCFPGRFDPLNVPRVSMDFRTRGARYKALLLFGDRPEAWRAAFGPRAAA